MKKQTFVIVLLCLQFHVYGQKIDFNEALSWEEVQQKASSENKFLFVDFYATWCGPCKYMADSIFTKPVVVAYLNDNLICYKVQVDQTDKDEKKIRDRYEQSAKLTETYNVRSLPTMIITSPEGDLLNMVEGSVIESEAFLGKIKKATDPEEVYLTQLEKYYGGKKDKMFLEKLLNMARRQEDEKIVQQLTYELALPNSN